jgi:hypothetical protein
MKTAIASLALIMLAVAASGISAVHAAQHEAQAAAETAAQTWLALIDAGNFEASWATASSLFRARVTQAQWANAVAGVRDSLGPLKSRTLQSAKLMHGLPDAPDGSYIVIQYASNFANKASATETVAPMLEADGTWHVALYYIK